MGAHLRAFDWTTTPLGAPETWSPALRMMTSFLLVNRFPLLLWWGPQFIQIYNDAYIPVLGAKHPSPGLGRPVSECWAEIWPTLQPLIETPFRGGPATWNEDIELEVQRHGFAEETHFTIAYSPVPDETAPGGIGGVLATVHEITGKVVGERRLGALRDLGLGLVDAKTVEAACALTARTLAMHAKDVPFAALYLSDPSGPPQLASATAGMPERDWPFAEEMIVSDGAAIIPIAKAGWLVAGISPRLRFDEFYQDFFLLLRTQIAAAIVSAQAFEEERKRAEELAELDRAKTAFFSNVSHELRTPLTLMLGPIEEELRDDPGNSRLDLAHRNSLRLLKLVNTLLDFSRIEAGRIEAAYEPTDLAEFTAELASGFRSVIEGAGLTFTVDCPRLPEVVHVDREMWEKIVLNLLSNAFKFTFTGEIKVAVRWCGDVVELVVADTGDGISEAELPRIFDRFHRAPGARSRTYEGTGIGLALVRELARLHSGEVKVESIEGRGSRFTVRIRTGTAHLPATRIGIRRTLMSTATRAKMFVEEIGSWMGRQGEEGTPTPPPPSAARGPAARLLIADDNSDMREYLSRLLSPHYEVRAVSDGQAALNSARIQRPDLILSDVMMPGLDGFALLHALRADADLRTIPVIFLSARAGEESRVEGLSEGADDYLIKPFSVRELLARVETHLKLARLRSESEAVLREAKERAEAANRAKDDFLAALSHELRNPLNPVLLSAGELARDESLDEDVREQIVMMRRNIELEARLIDDLLDLTRITRGKLDLHRAGVDVHALLQHTQEIVHGDAAARHVELRFALEASEHHAHADAARLQQVFWNLMKNAIKFSAGAGHVTVRTFNPAPSRLAITVVDDGIGIAPEALTRIFAPFDQGDLDGRHRFGGLGLGLAISKAIVDLHDGELRVSSAGAGHGATFTVELASTAAAPAKIAQASTPPAAGPPLRLLVVDDHEATLGILTRLLERAGHQVHAARSVEEAIALACEHECDLLISDLGLPDGSGADVMRGLRERGCPLPGIALSGYGTEKDVHESREAGFATHLVKPVDMDELRRALHAASCEIMQGSIG